MKSKFFILLSLLAAIFCTKNLLAQDAASFKRLSAKGKPMLFLPHIGCSSAMWQPIAEKYLTTNSCYQVDFAGFAGKQPVDSNYTEKYVKSLVDFIIDNGLKECILVGQNYGAFIAVKVAKEIPQNIRCLVLSDFFPKLAMVLGKDMSNEKLNGILASTKQNIISSDSTSFADYQTQMASGMNFMDTSYVPKFVNWQMNSDRKTLAGTLIKQMSSDLLPFFEQNNIPILVFNTWYFGKTYKKMPFSEAEITMRGMYPKAKNVQHAITENAKDFIALDQPIWFKEQTDLFLKQKFGAK